MEIMSANLQGLFMYAKTCGGDEPPKINSLLFDSFDFIWIIRVGFQFNIVRFFVTEVIHDQCKKC